MATLIPTPKKARSLPPTDGISDERVKNSIELINNALRALQDKGYTDEFLAFMRTAQYEKLFEVFVWNFVKKYFVEEQMVRDVTIDGLTFKLATKKYNVLPTQIPRNRLLEYDLSQSSSNSSGNGSASIDNGYFTITEIDGNKVKVVNGYDEGNAFCGYVVEDNVWVAVNAEESSEITQDVFLFLELADKTFKTIALATVTGGADVSGWRLIGLITVETVDGNNSLTIHQAHVGIIYNNFASEPFDIMITSVNTILVKGGSFQMNDTIEVLADSPFTVTGTAPIYIETDGTGSPVAYVQATPVFDIAIARTVIGKVYFADSKITRVEPYIRGWFHCHVIGDCDG